MINHTLLPFAERKLSKGSIMKFEINNFLEDKYLTLLQNLLLLIHLNLLLVCGLRLSTNHQPVAQDIVRIMLCIMSAIYALPSYTFL